MYYRINISKNGTHFFATASHSVQDESKLGEVLPELVNRFPSDDGFEIEVSHVVESGKILGVAELTRICTTPATMATRTASKKKIVARLTTIDGATMCISQRGAAFEIFWDGGVLHNGDGSRRFQTISEAMDYASEEFTLALADELQ